MLTCIQIISRNKDILTISILWFSVMLLVGNDNCCGVKGSKQTGIVFSYEPKFIALIIDFDFIVKIFAKSDEVKFAVMKASGEVPLQNIHFLIDNGNFSISLYCVFYHCCLLFLLDILLL